MDDGRLVFWDVLPGGIAERAGISAGSVLLGFDDHDINTTEPRFRLAGEYKLTVSQNGTEKTVKICTSGCWT
jgi:S1-C subfamily serine protease